MVRRAWFKNMTKAKKKSKMAKQNFFLSTVSHLQFLEWRIWRFTEPEMAVLSNQFAFWKANF